MDLELWLREVLVVQKAGVGFADRVMARVGSAEVIDIRARRRSRLIMIGTLAVVGVAAAMLALQLSGLRGHAPQSAIAEPLAANNDVPAIQSPPPDEIAINPSAAPAAPAPVDETRRYTVLVIPPVDRSGSPGARAATEVFHAALIGELRLIPDVVVVDSGTPFAERKANPDYQLTVTALETRTFPSGAVEAITTNGNSPFHLGIHTGTALAQQALLWPVEVRIDDVQDASFYSIMSTFSGDGRSNGSNCRYSASSSVRHIGFGSSRNPSSCVGKAQVAAALADFMRPTDPAVLQRQMVAQLRDASSIDEKRRSAMATLSSLKSSGVALDDASISAVVDFIAGLAPARRAQEWSQLGSWKNPRFVAPLLDALRQDTDEKARLELLALLAVSYREDQRVLAAIETAARSDPSQTVRMTARRSLYGDAEWNSYVISTLQDASLSYEERLQPLLAPSTSQAGSPSIVKDERIVMLLVRLVREGSSDPSRVQAAARVLGQLNNVDVPAVLDLQLELLQDSDRLGYRGQLLTLQALTGLMRHRDEPRVRKVLDEIVAGGGNQTLRYEVEQLSRMDSPVPR